MEFNLDELMSTDSPHIIQAFVKTRIKVCQCPLCKEYRTERAERELKGEKIEKDRTITKIKEILGYFAAIKLDDTTVGTGFSLCQKKDKKVDGRGKKIALRRALVNSKEVIPNSMKSEYERFLKRCQKYFKGCTIKTNQGSLTCF